MIRKSVKRFSEKIVLKQKARWRFILIHRALAHPQIWKAPHAKLIFCLADYSAAFDITERGMRASQPSMNCFSQARSAAS